MATTKYIEEAFQSDVKLIQHTGNAWATATLPVKNTGETAFTLHEVDVFLGCLKEDWKLVNELTNDDFVKSCTTGNFSIPKSKNWKATVNSKNLSLWMFAAYAGLNVTDGAVSGETIIIQEEVTLTVDDAYKLTMSLANGFAADVSGAHKILKVYDNDTKAYWSEAAAADDSAFVFKVNAADPDTIEFEGVDGAVVENDTFQVQVQYAIAMAAGDLKFTEDGETFPELMDLTFSWLVKYVSGTNKGKKAYLVAVAKNCARTGTQEIGGAPQEYGSQMLEFNVNFAEDGDVEFYLKALA